MACPCCCPCRSNDQMPCGYEWPTIQMEYRYGKSEPWTPPGWPFSENLGASIFVQASVSVSFSPVPSRWYQNNFCGWIDASQGGGANVTRKVFYMPGPLFGCPEDNSRVMLVVADGGSIAIGDGVRVNAVSGQSKSQWLEYCLGGYTNCSLSGFDFEDWRWACDKFIIGSFVRSRRYTQPGRSDSYRGFNFTVPESSFVESVTVTVPNQ